MNRIDKYHWIILLVVCLIFASPTKAETKENILSLSTAQVKQLQAASDHFKKTGSQDSITLQLNLANQTLITKVVPIEIKGKGYKGTITSKKGKKKDRTKTFFYSGFIGASEDKNFFKLTLIDYPNKLTEWVGFFRYDGKFYNLKSENDNSLQITQLSNAEIAKLIERCGAHVDEVSESDFTAQDFSGTSLKQADIATEADYEYYVSQGRSESRVNSSILAIINGLNGIYETHLGIN